MLQKFTHTHLYVADDNLTVPRTYARQIVSKQPAGVCTQLQVKRNVYAGAAASGHMFLIGDPNYKVRDSFIITGAFNIDGMGVRPLVTVFSKNSDTAISTGEVAIANNDVQNGTQIAVQLTGGDLTDGSGMGWCEFACVVPSTLFEPDDYNYICVSISVPNAEAYATGVLRLHDKTPTYFDPIK